jgi:hypothetical protein
VQNALDDVASNNARHVIGCSLAQETRVQRALDDMASNICPALKGGAGRAAAAWRCHTIECLLTEGTRVQHALKDVAK